ncbi:hypothetical protein [Epilithonimonas sp.]|uniref:hypothetical protein n=1 Tax=Epilithonimonas sp. TaxID=2894511 RepID=UPI002FDE2D0F
MEAKTMYAVEHYYSNDERSTYEIFETLNEAESFCSDKNNWNENHFPLFIFKADFNSDLIYQDENRNWNYDDFSGTILKYHSFRKTINEIKLEVE